MTARGGAWRERRGPIRPLSPAQLAAPDVVRDVRQAGCAQRWQARRWDPTASRLAVGYERGTESPRLAVDGEYDPLGSQPENGRRKTCNRGEVSRKKSGRVPRGGVAGGWTAPAFPEAVTFESCSHIEVLSGGIVICFGLCGRDVADGAEQALIIEPTFPRWAPVCEATVAPIARRAIISAALFDAKIWGLITNG